jgi:hypothetical protein
MARTRITLTGLENGDKRTLAWTKGGELVGDADLQTRFRQAWEATDQETFRLSLDKHNRAHFRVYLAESILKNLCQETLDLEWSEFHSSDELQAIADKWNAGQDKRRYTADEVRVHLEESAGQNHHGPPYAWEEIEAMFDAPGQPMAFPPPDTPRCLECLRPMEWLWFSSDPETWEMMCGRAGWVPICRECKTWRACRVTLMN